MVKKFILKFHHLSDHDEEDDNPSESYNVPEIFKIEGNIFDFETPLELPRMVRVGSMTYFQDHRWYDKLVDGKLKDETLALKAKIEGSWGDATPRSAGGRGCEANNIGYTQENQGHKGDPIPEPLNCKVRRFEMMKYSFDDDEEYITIKESEYLKHSKHSLDAYRELLRLIDEGWVVTTPDE
ncbi:hypothetical protein Tco_1494124 [Tanacetum coccineum]